MSFREELLSRVSSFTRLTDAQADALQRHYELLVRWNERLNLTAIRSQAEAVERHYAESLFLAAHLPAEAATAVDIGSGGGFPGVPLAVAKPGWGVTLVDSHRRKAVFLREAVRELPQVRVLSIRASELTERFSWQVSRGVNWRDLPVCAERLALLVGESTAAEAKLRGVRWEEPVPLPWGDRRVLLLGRAAPAL